MEETESGDWVVETEKSGEWVEEMEESGEWNRCKKVEEWGETLQFTSI